jgi:accessory gene regulator B
MSDMTIKKQATKLSNGLVNINVIERESHAIYVYGFELLISAAVNILLMAIISIVFRNYFGWVLFLISFISLRTTAGGYHASSHAKCIIITTTGFTALLLLSRINIDWTNIIIFTAVISFILILLMSPVEADNKKLNEKVRTRNRKVSVCIGVINLLIAAIATFYMQNHSELLIIYFAGVFAASLSMFVAKVLKVQKK